MSSMPLSWVAQPATVNGKSEDGLWWAISVPSPRPDGLGGAAPR